MLGQDGQACGHRPWCQGLALSVARPTHAGRRVCFCASPPPRGLRDRRGEAVALRPMPAGLPTIPRHPQATRDGRWNVKAGKDSTFNLNPNAMACLSIILLLCFDLARENECKTTLRPRRYRRAGGLVGCRWTVRGCVSLLPPARLFWVCSSSSFSCCSYMIPSLTHTIHLRIQARFTISAHSKPFGS